MYEKIDLNWDKFEKIAFKRLSEITWKKQNRRRGIKHNQVFVRSLLLACNVGNHFHLLFRETLANDRY